MTIIKIKNNTWAEVLYNDEDGHPQTKNILFEKSDILNCLSCDRVCSYFNEDNVMVHSCRIILKKENNSIINEDTWIFKMEDINFETVLTD